MEKGTKHIVENNTGLRNEDLRAALESGENVSFVIKGKKQVVYIFIRTLVEMSSSRWKIEGHSRDCVVKGTYSTVTQTGELEFSLLKI